MSMPVKHCAAGHALTGSNVTISGGRTRCKKCLTEIRMRYFYAHKDTINRKRRDKKHREKGR